LVAPPERYSRFVDRTMCHPHIRKFAGSHSGPPPPCCCCCTGFFFLIAGRTLTFWFRITTGGLLHCPPLYASLFCRRWSSASRMAVCLLAQGCSDRSTCTPTARSLLLIRCVIDKGLRYTVIKVLCKRFMFPERHYLLWLTQNGISSQLLRVKDTNEKSLHITTPTGHREGTELDNSTAPQIPLF
jgi:hypothetical protein